ncbi:PhnE/PtxC family ABC transporter permease [Lichenibacterium ramalinae]|uniref:ABC transporter permease n=1 Tax=Lichenibacterium ramalinae TaxID=2316527 RepID=A0A4Q2RBT4_9HYPH|nr:ABC transporter permease [Lichenibacterium ramalinae]RYB03204.1 ABC transporter permease [Lichenibacterium ramalinae]
MTGLDRAVRRIGFTGVSLAILALGIAAAAVGDFAVTASHPGPELLRMLHGLLTPDLRAVNLWALVDTLAFAVLGVGLGCASGFVLALGFPHLAAIRALCAGLRSVHELFWALLLMQVLGLGPATGVLAIALPYAGIFAKVFAEMIEEADRPALRVLPPGTGAVSAFFYAGLPDLIDQFGHYTLYRLECGLRSTLVLGFIGLPTVGFELDAAFKAGAFPQAAALLFSFYALVASRHVWARPWTVPFLVVGAALVLPAGLPGGDAWQNLVRFATRDVVPAPLRGADLLSGAPWAAAFGWLGDILRHQVLPGALATLVLSQVALCTMAALALALFPLVSRRFAGPVGRPLGRALLVVVRSTPDYLLAYVLLQALGPSMLPAVIALALHNGAVLAYLLGRQADALAYRADAPRGANLYFYETLPRLYGQFLAYALYRWDVILRESAIFGILGVATLGFYVDGAIAELRLDVAAVLVLATAALSLGVDALSRALRRALRVEPGARRRGGATSPPHLELASGRQGMTYDGT